jgi:hypothetical protein
MKDKSQTKANARRVVWGAPSVSFRLDFNLMAGWMAKAESKFVPKWNFLF